MTQYCAGKSQRSPQVIKHLLEYKKKIESELDRFCNDILKLIEKDIQPACKNSESKVFFLKMQGDYYRYISEYA